MRYLIITTINPVNEIIEKLCLGAIANNYQFLVVGDKKTPTEFLLDKTIYLDIKKQSELFSEFASLVPLNHYARKNLGYIFAIREGATIIKETDDDNIPYENFWEPPQNKDIKELICDTAWFNIYRYFTNTSIWPRGFPLEFLHKRTKFFIQENSLEGLIFQGLADQNPDVDAIFRLTHQLPVTFEKKDKIMLGKGVWSPFNSQNTVFFKEAFPLLYLPATCSFRMTDIWRSLVAQRILWEYGAGIVYHEATVYQERNEHNLLKDFKDEIPGYLNNDEIRVTLEEIKLRGNDMLFDLVLCYKTLVDKKFLNYEELPILEGWVKELKKILV